MRQVALDVHKTFCEVAIREGTKAYPAGRVATERETLELFAESLCPTDEVVMEATGPAMEIARILEPHVARVVVAYAQEVRAISHARVKSDRFDARTLANLLGAGMLESVWVPDAETQGLRRRVARRASLVRQRTRAKNEIHAALSRSLLGRSPVGDLFTSEGCAWLEAQELGAEEDETVAGCLRQIDFLDGEVAEIDRKLAQWTVSSPEAKRLMSIPGVGAGVAVTLMPAIGDVSRFSGQRQLVAFLGLDPKVRQSGEEAPRHGRISKRGNAQARSALVEAAWIALRQPGPLRAFGERVRARKGRAGGSGRRGAQARLYRLAAADQGRGLRLRAALEGARQAAPCRTQRRSAAATPTPRRAADLRHRCRTGERARPRGTRRDRLPTADRRLEGNGSGQGRRRRDTGARIFWALYGASSAAGQGPKACALARRRRRPEGKVSHSRNSKGDRRTSDLLDLTFIRSVWCAWGSLTGAQSHLQKSHRRGCRRLSVSDFSGSSPAGRSALMRCQCSSQAVEIQSYQGTRDSSPSAPAQSGEGEAATEPARRPGGASSSIAQAVPADLLRFASDAQPAAASAAPPMERASPPRASLTSATYLRNGVLCRCRLHPLSCVGPPGRRAGNEEALSHTAFAGAVDQTGAELCCLSRVGAAGGVRQLNRSLPLSARSKPRRRTRLIPPVPVPSASDLPEPAARLPSLADGAAPSGAGGPRRIGRLPNSRARVVRDCSSSSLGGDRRIAHPARPTDAPRFPGPDRRASPGASLPPRHPTPNYAPAFSTHPNKIKENG